MLYTIGMIRNPDSVEIVHEYQDKIIRKVEAALAQKPSSSEGSVRRVDLKINETFPDSEKNHTPASLLVRKNETSTSLYISLPTNSVEIISHYSSSGHLHACNMEIMTLDKNAEPKYSTFELIPDTLVQHGRLTMNGYNMTDKTFFEKHHNRLYLGGLWILSESVWQNNPNSSVSISNI